MVALDSRHFLGAATVTATVAAWAISGCADDLPPVEKIIEHRILSAPVRVTGPHDPGQVPAGYVRAEALPGETVELVPFSVGPQGVVDPDTLDLRWIACELHLGGGAFACLAENFPLGLGELPQCSFPTLETLVADGRPPALDTPCLLATGSTPSFVVPPSQGVLEGANIELTAIGSTPGGTPTEQCARALLGGQSNVPNDCLYAVQVVSVGPKLRLLEWLADQGVSLGEFERPDPRIVDAPDLHPTISSFSISVVDENGEMLVAPVEVPSGGEFSVRAGQILRVDTASPESDLQYFRIPTNGGASFEVSREAYLGQWFITWGELLSSQSLDATSYNEWTLSPANDDAEHPPGGVAHLYYVVRDGRNGAAHWWVSLRFIP